MFVITFLFLPFCFFIDIEVIVINNENSQLTMYFVPSIREFSLEQKYQGKIREKLETFGKLQKNQGF